MRKLLTLVTLSALAACQLFESSPDSAGSVVINQLANGTGNSKAWKIENAALAFNKAVAACLKQGMFDA